MYSFDEIADQLNAPIRIMEKITAFYERMGVIESVGDELNKGVIKVNKEAATIWGEIMRLPSVA